MPFCHTSSSATPSTVLSSTALPQAPQKQTKSNAAVHVAPSAAQATTSKIRPAAVHSKTATRCKSRALQPMKKTKFGDSQDRHLPQQQQQQQQQQQVPISASYKQFDPTWTVVDEQCLHMNRHRYPIRGNGACWGYAIGHAAGLIPPHKTYDHGILIRLKRAALHVLEDTPVGLEWKKQLRTAAFTATEAEWQTQLDNIRDGVHEIAEVPGRRYEYCGDLVIKALAYHLQKDIFVLQDNRQHTHANGEIFVNYYCKEQTLVHVRGSQSTRRRLEHPEEVYEYHNIQDHLPFSEACQKIKDLEAAENPPLVIAHNCIHGPCAHFESTLPC